MKHQVNPTNIFLPLKWSYMEKCPSPLKYFINTVSRHIFSKPFQLRIGNGALGKHFQMMCISKLNHYYECNQLKTFGHIFRKCSRVAC